MANKVNDNTEIALPLRNIISMIAAVAVATWAYFGIVERLNKIETQQTLMLSDLEKNTEFRIKWPRGEMGALPDDAKQDLKIEYLQKEVEQLKEVVKELEISNAKK